MILKRCIFVLLVFVLSLSGCKGEPKQIEFDKSQWDEFDAGLYSENRYGMALWLIENYDFIGKTKEEIWDKLCSERAGVFIFVITMIVVVLLWTIPYIW